jgi:hypothetical protein
MAVTFVPVAAGAIEKLVGVLPGRASPIDAARLFARPLPARFRDAV